MFRESFNPQAFSAMIVLIVCRTQYSFDIVDMDCGPVSQLTQFVQCLIEFFSRTEEGEEILVGLLYIGICLLGRCHTDLKQKKITVSCEISIE